VHGETDEVIPHDHNKEWLKEHAPEAQLVSLPETTHFFHGKLVELQQLVADFLTPLT
jgi:alpha/beta superfamily hydrolase